MVNHLRIRIDQVHICAKDNTNHGNLLKFTPSEDGLAYTKVIPEDQLDVDLDDKCKYQKSFRAHHFSTAVL